MFVAIGLVLLTFCWSVQRGYLEQGPPNPRQWTGDRLSTPESPQGCLKIKIPGFYSLKVQFQWV